MKKIILLALLVANVAQAQSNKVVEGRIYPKTSGGALFTPGSVPYVGAGGLTSQDNANLFWDSLNFRLGLGTITPSQKLEVNGGSYFGNITGSQQFDFVTRGDYDALRLYSGLNPSGGSVNPPSIGFYRSIGTPEPNPRFRIQGFPLTSNDTDGFLFSSPRSSTNWIGADINGGNETSFNLAESGVSNVLTFLQRPYFTEGTLVVGRDPPAATPPVSAIIRSGQKNYAVSDVDGSDLTLQAGRGTGAATGGGNLYLQTPDATVSGTALQAKTTKMAVLRNGDVGIGDTTPESKLEVAGMVRTTDVGNVPTTGAGLEIYYFSGTSHLLSYDRTGAASRPLTLTSSLLTSSSLVDGQGGFRATGAQTPASGEGLEIVYSSGISYLLSYDRSGSAWKPIMVNASTMTINNQTAGDILKTQYNATDLLTVTSANGSKIRGTTTNDAAAAGFVGETFAGSLVRSSANGLADGVSENVDGATALALTAGDWDVSGACGITTAASTVTTIDCAVATTSATLPGTDVIAVPTTGEFRINDVISVTLASVEKTYTIPTYRVSLSATTTLYLVARAAFSAGSVSAFGSIQARRVR